MVVKRIVVDIAASDVRAVQDFYATVFDLAAVMDLDWIATLASGGHAPVQLSIASEGGSGAPVPDLSIEVDDVEAVFLRAQEWGAKIVYDLTDEPWGVRRFFVQDPAGKVVNVLAHLP